MCGEHGRLWKYRLYEHRNKRRFSAKDKEGEGCETGQGTEAVGESKGSVKEARETEKEEHKELRSKDKEDWYTVPLQSLHVQDKG